MQHNDNVVSPFQSSMASPFDLAWMVLKQWEDLPENWGQPDGQQGPVLSAEEAIFRQQQRMRGLTPEGQPLVGQGTVRQRQRPMDRRDAGRPTGRFVPRR